MATTEGRSRRAGTRETVVARPRPAARRAGHTFALDDIVDAAVSEFAKRGYRGTNLAHVSRRLGVTRQALYYYFPRKHDLLRAICLRFFDALDERVHAAAGPKAPPSDRFVAMLAAHYAVVAERPQLTTVIVHEEAALTQKAREEILRRRRAHQQLFTEAYKVGVRDGAFADAPAGTAVGLLLGAGNWSYRWFKPKRGPMTPNEFANFATSFFRQGFLTESEKRKIERAARR